MTTVNPDDQFAVNRNNKVYSVEQSTIMASLEFTDYLAVNRDDVTYKITGEEFISSVLDPLELTPIVTIIDGESVQTASVSANTVGGKQPYTFNYSWRTQDKNGNIEIIPGAPDSSIYVIPQGYYELGIGCYVTVTDSLSQTAAALSNFDKVAVAVNVQSVVLTENNDSDTRTLTTDEITSVVSTQSQTEMYIWDGNYYSSGQGDVVAPYPVNLADVKANGTLVTGNQASVTASQSLIIVPVGTETGKPFPVADGNITWTFVSGEHSGHYAADGTSLGGGGTYNATTDPPVWEWVSAPNQGDWNAGYELVNTAAYIILSNKGTGGGNATAGTYPTLVSGTVENTQLTFSGDKDLVYLKAGDAVKQNNSPVTPTTSAITSLTQVQGIDYSGTTTMNEDDPGDNKRSFDGDTSTGGGYIGNTQVTVIGLEVTINSSMAYWSPDSEGRISTWYFTRFDGATESVAFDAKTNNGWTDIPLPAGWGLPFTCSKIEAIRQTDILSEQINAIRVDSTILVDVPGLTTLTLSDATDLDLFEVGDVAKQEPKSQLTDLLYSVDIGSSGRAGVADRTSQFNSTKQSIALATGSFDTPAVDGAIMLDVGSDASEIDWTFTSGGSITAQWFASNDLINWVDSGIDSDEGTLRELREYRYWWYGTNTNSCTNTFSGTLVGQSTGIVSSVGPDNILTLGDTDGTWNAGPDNYATGPEKNITGTVGSVDATGRTVTLSEASGVWSANTGNYLLGPQLAFTDGPRFTLQSFNAAIRSKNNSTEPITYSVKGSVDAKLLANSVTSVITDTETQVLDYTYYVVGPTAPQYPTSNLFDGDIESACEGLSSGELVTFTPPLPISCNILRFYMLRSNGATSSFSVNNTDMKSLVPNNSDWGWVQVPASELTTFSFSRGTSGDVISISAIEIDGKILTDGEFTSLTLTDDTDLANFPVGTTVSQIGGNTPVSSAITNVVSGGNSGTKYMNGTITGSPTISNPNNMFDGDDSTNATINFTGSGGNPKYTFSGTTTLDYLDTLSIQVSNPGGSYPTGIAVEIYDGSTRVQKIELDTTNRYDETPVFATLTFTNPTPGITQTITAIKVNRGGSNETALVRLKNVSVSGKKVGGPTELLTLTDQTNLANFRVGDVLSSEVSGDITIRRKGGGTPAMHYIQIYNYKVNGSTLIGTTEYDSSLSGSDGFKFNSSGPFVGEYPGNDGRVEGGIITWDSSVYTGIINTLTISCNLGGTSYDGTYEVLTNGVVTGEIFIPASGGNEIRDIDISQYIAKSNVSITAIDEAAPSITTDGGSWSGTDGTGDQGDGRYEPAQEWSQYGEGTMNEGYGWDKAFDGVITNTTDQASPGVGTAVWTPATPIPFSGTVTLYLLNEQSNKCFINGYDIYVLTGVVAGGYNTPVSCSAAQLGGFLQSISLVRDGTGAYLSGVEVDGSLLINSSVPDNEGEAQVTGPTFTATGAVDSSGSKDVVRAPVTSVITDVVESNNVYSDNISANQAFAADSPKTNAFDGDANTLAALDSNAADATITWDASSYNLSTADNDIVVRSATTNHQWKAIGSNGTQTIQSVSDPAGFPLPDVGTLQTLEIIGPAASLMYVKVGGAILTDNTASTTLTLTDTTELALFTPGDVVQVDGVKYSSFWDADGSTGTAQDPTRSFDGNLETFTSCQNSGKDVIWKNQGGPITGSIRIRAKGLTSGDAGQLFVNGSEVSLTGGTTLTWYPVSNPLNTIQITDIGASHGCVAAVEVDGVVLADGPDVKVTAINMATPSITTDGGIWNIGQVVTGPVKTITEIGPYMTLSNSDGRWMETHADYQTDLKLNTKVRSDDQILIDSVLYTLLDAEGNVSDLSVSDPGYKAQVTGATIQEDVTISFPAVLGDGQAPDSAIPDGASFNVDVLATNVAGSDEALHGDTGASVTPVDTSAPEGTFKPVIYTGNGTTQSINCGFSPSLVWIKSRTDASASRLVDVVRGPEKGLISSSTDAEFDGNNVTSFNTDGFSVGTDGNVNALEDYVAWCWAAGDTTVTNNDGTIASQVRSNGQFSIVKYTGNNTLSTIGHGLGSIPKLIIAKSLRSENDWAVYSETLGTGRFLALNSTGAPIDSTGVWGDEATPTSNVFTVGDGNQANYSDEMIAYCWAESPTQSIGSYTGNSSTTGPVITTGFEPAFVLVKNTSASANWVILDNKRSTTNPRQDGLFPNSNSAESTNSAYSIDFNSTGFQIVTSDAEDSGLNNSGNIYIYAAFAGTTTRFDADDANDVAAFNVVKAGLDAFPENKRVNQKSIRRAILESSLNRATKLMLISDQVDDDVTDAGPFALDQYYPLYETLKEAQEASSNSNAHDHTIDGVEYYMPDAGQTIYHGNYPGSGY